MNAEQYLRNQGWQGSGHSLDSTGRGIKKPLLISHKTDQLGLGKKKAAHTTDDQWWMRAFDASLQSIGTGKEVRRHVTCVYARGEGDCEANLL
jgi:nucleolar protein TMA23